MDLYGRLADGGGDVTEGRLKRLSLWVRETVGPEIGLDWHGHNDRGLALANALLRAPRAQGEVRPTENGSLRKARGWRRRRDGRPLEASISPPADGVARHGRPPRRAALRAARSRACAIPRVRAPEL